MLPHPDQSILAPLVGDFVQSISYHRYSLTLFFGGDVTIVGEYHVSILAEGAEPREIYPRVLLAGEFSDVLEIPIRRATFDEEDSLTIVLSSGLSIKFSTSSDHEGYTIHTGGQIYGV